MSRRRPDRLALAEYLTAPYPAYLSLQTALYQHGMIEQIPSMIYLVSLARGARVATTLGTYSVHYVQPSSRGRMFASLPELELPPAFRRRAAREWIQRIPSKRLKTIVAQRLDEVLARAA